jgi:hypothetical protein
MENKELKVYIAGPYNPVGYSTHEAPKRAHKNVMKAIQAGIEIIKKGHLPYIPHMGHWINLESEEELPPDYWYKADLAWLDDCDALYYMASSKGADLELKYATEHGKKIFFNLDEIPSVI